jgi:putative DNA primase/helicase
MSTVDNVIRFPGSEWKSRLAKKRNGEPYGDERNVMFALEEAPEFIGMLQYDAFSDQIKVLRAPPWAKGDAAKNWTHRVWSDGDRIELQAWLQTEGLPVNKAAVVQDSVIAVSQRCQFHPVRDYLTSIRSKWDGEPRIKRWLIDYLGGTDDQQYLEEIGEKFLIGAVARAMDPGCQMDTMLVLEGAQGLGKSTAVRALFRNWTSDVAHDMGNKDAAILIQGIWGAELSELTALARSQVEAVKAFISRRVDRYRPPYGRNAIDRPRQTVFIATTNECEYLQDTTGGRRFWPVDCEKIDSDAIVRDRDQLWAEAVSRYLRGEKWHLDRPAEALAYREQNHRRRVTPMEMDVLEYADRMITQGHTRLDMKSVLRDALGIDTTQTGPQSGPAAKEASRILTSNGWIRYKPTGWGKNRTVWYEYRSDRDPTIQIQPTSQADLTSRK